MPPNAQDSGPALSGLSTAFATASKLSGVKKVPCNLYIDGVWYDLSSFVTSHPGGDIITHYHDKDATDVFHAFHSEKTRNELSQRKKVPESQCPPTPAASARPTAGAFRRFKKMVEDAGLFEVSLPWYAYKTASTFALLGAAVTIMRYGYPIVGAFVLGLFWQQMGWLSHEYCHHQVFNERSYGNAAGVILGNLFQGFSSTWWKDRHNSHHGSTNIVDIDPDLDNLPLMVWSKKDLPRMKDMPFSRKIAQYQVVYFWFVLALLRLIWMMQSYFFVRTMYTSHNSVWRSQAKSEFIAINLHYAFQLAILWQCPFATWPAVFMISNCLAGFGIGIIVFFNHYAAHHFSTENAKDVDFLILQARSTRNMSGPPAFLDYICGGLHLQLEHHLFPSLPRHNLRKCQVMLREFCKKEGIPYLEEDFVPGVTIAAKQLMKMSRHVADYDRELSAAQGSSKKRE